MVVIMNQIELFVCPSCYLTECPNPGECYNIAHRNEVLEEVAKEFDKMRSLGDTAASFACYVRNMKS
jgi:molybdopterin/thiamine biosynthesis adenylyltransferase